MTRKERVLIKRAIAYIHMDEDQGGDYDKGMTILAKLVGIKNIPDQTCKRLSVEDYFQDEGPAQPPEGVRDEYVSWLEEELTRARENAKGEGR